MSKYECTVCGYIYDPKEGDEASEILAGTSFKELPDDWVCPICGAGKDEFYYDTGTGYAIMDGGEDKDILKAGSGGSKLTGGSGNDELYGGTHRVEGGSGKI